MKTLQPTHTKCPECLGSCYHTTTCSKRFNGEFPLPAPTKWTARSRTWKGNHIGFRVFRDGVVYKKHVNALTAEEAITKAKNNMYSDELKNIIKLYNELPTGEQDHFRKMINGCAELNATATR